MATQEGDQLADGSSVLIEEEENKEEEETIEEETYQLSEEDLVKTAKDYTEYLIVNSQQEKHQLDDRIQSIVFRVEEFQRQLDWMHQNITSTAEKVTELHTYTRNLTDLFNKIDQMEAFVGVIGSNVDTLEQTVAKAERDLEPSKLRKVFSVIPGMRKTQPKDSSTEPWQPPQLFNTKDYFTPPRIKPIEETLTAGTS